MAFEFGCVQSGYEVGADSEEKVVLLVQEHARRRREIELDGETIAEQTERT